MERLTNKLRQLRKDDPDVALLIDTFEQIDTVYRASLEAMGASHSALPEVANCAEVTVSFDPSSSSSED
jgi:hypothetical protein